MDPTVQAGGNVKANIAEAIDADIDRLAPATQVKRRIMVKCAGATHSVAATTVITDTVG